MDWSQVPEVYLQEILTRMVASQRQLRISTLRQVCRRFKLIMDSTVTTLRSPYNLPKRYLQYDERQDLVKLIPFFNQFTALQSVEFQENVDLKWLQALKTANLPLLKTLSLNACILEYGWEHVIPQLTNLSALSLHSCLFKGVNLQPLSTLSNLQTLDLSYATKMRDDFVFDLEHIKNLTNLTNLNLCQCSCENLELLEQFPNLRSLNLRWGRLQSLPRSFFQNLDLVELDASRSAYLNVSSLENLTFLTSLTYLNLRCCINLNQDAIEIIGKLNRLKSLNLSQNQWIENLENLSNLTKLEYLNVSKCSLVQPHHFSVLVCFKNLKELEIGAIGLRDLPSQISYCTQLISINAWWNKQLLSLGALETLRNLRTVEVPDCTTVSWVTWLYLVNVCKLRKLNVSGCSRGNQARFLQNVYKNSMFSLRHFEIANAGVTDSDVIFFVKKMPDLRFLNLSKNNQITSLGALYIFNGLIDLEYCNVCNTGINPNSELFHKIT